MSNIPASAKGFFWHRGMAQGVTWERASSRGIDRNHFIIRNPLLPWIMGLIHSSISVPNNSNTSPRDPTSNMALVGIKFPHIGFGEHIKIRAATCSTSWMFLSSSFMFPAPSHPSCPAELSVSLWIKHVFSSSTLFLSLQEDSVFPSTAAS